jgi:hypothetical protein
MDGIRPAPRVPVESGSLRPHGRKGPETEFRRYLFFISIFFNGPLSPQDMAVSLLEIREEDRPLLT